MLMLRHVYRTSPILLESVLQALLEKDDIEIGPRFEQQAVAGHSVPDAVLSQSPLHIYVEAKHGDGLNEEQLERHLRSLEEYEHPTNTTFLIGLTRNKLSEDEIEHLQSKARLKDVTFASATYRDLIDTLRTACASTPSLSEILDDYHTFIGSHDLLPTQYRTMVALLCGQSWNANVQHGAYFELAERNPKWTRAHFIGVYHQKHISHVGRVETSAICRRSGDKLEVLNVEFGALTSDQELRIKAIMDALNGTFDGFIETPHRYYLVDRFEETDVRKETAGGMMGHRYLDIPDLVGRDDISENIPTLEVAAFLAGARYK